MCIIPTPGDILNILSFFERSGFKIRKIGMELVKAILLVAIIATSVNFTMGGALEGSPLAVWERAKERTWRDQVVNSLDQTVVASLKDMGLAPEDLYRLYVKKPDSKIRFLWSWDKETQQKAAVLALYIKKQNPKIDALTAWREAAAFLHYSSKYNIPLSLAVAVANTESHFDPKAKSNFGAMGVMQVAWHVHYNLLMANGIKSQSELYDPEKGIAAGSLLLSRYLKHYKSTKIALKRYYGGPVGKYWAKVSRYKNKVENFVSDIEL
jgi:hypothetical protein